MEITYFEKLLIEKATAFIEDSPDLNHSQFALKVFGGNLKTAVRRWGRMRKFMQHPSIEDGLLIAEAMGVSFSQLAWELENEIRQRGLKPTAPVASSSSTLPFTDTDRAIA